MQEDVTKVCLLQALYMFVRDRGDGKQIWGNIIYAVYIAPEQNASVLLHYHSCIMYTFG